MDDLLNPQLRNADGIPIDYTNLDHHENYPNIFFSENSAIHPDAYARNDIAGGRLPEYETSWQEERDTSNRARQMYPSNYVGLTLDTADSSLRLHASSAQDGLIWSPDTSHADVHQIDVLDASLRELILHGEPIPIDLIPEGFANSEYVYQAGPHTSSSGANAGHRIASHGPDGNTGNVKECRKGGPNAGWYDLESTTKLDKRHVLHLMGPLWGYLEDRNGQKCARRRMSKYITPDLARLILDNKENKELLKEIAAQTPPLRHSPLDVDEQIMRQHLRDRGMHVNSVSTYMRNAKKVSMSRGISLRQAVLDELAKYRPDKKNSEKGKRKCTSGAVSY